MAMESAPDLTPDRSARKGTARTVSLPVAGNLPHAMELEQAILGAIMLEKDAFIRVTDVLSQDMFYKPSHPHIFEAMLLLSNASEPIDKLTVVEKLRKMDKLSLVGGPYYIAELTSRVASAANIEHHAHIVAQKYLQRELVRICRNIADEAVDESSDIFELMDAAEKQLYELSTDKLRRESVSMSHLAHQTIQELQALIAKGDGVTGVTTGFVKLDELTSGWQPSDMVVLAARPAMGKTAFVLSLARNAALLDNKAVAIFSLEMAATQLVRRLISAEAEIELSKMRNGQLSDYEWQQLNQRITRLSEAPIFIDDTPALSLFDLRTKCRRLKTQHDIQLIIIDYLQLMTAESRKGGNREQEISAISRGLKVLAKELNVPVIALSQLSRAPELRSGFDKRPQLSDLRESGAIEQDADMVLFLFRPDYYGLTEDEDGNSTREMCEVIIAKQRNGPIGSAKLRFVGQFSRFQDFDPDYFSGNMPSAFYNGGFEGNGGSPSGGAPPADLGAGFKIFPSKMNQEEDLEGGFTAPF
ncbi:MAG: replicative DNA helicase [Bacteroidetes bacterium]|nr:replicative DNA helicase [Bacteroidota bacterium]